MLLVCVLITACGDDLNESQEIIQADNPVLSKRSCGLESHMESLMSSPAKKEAYEKRLEKFNKYSAGRVENRELCTEPVLLPMAVHFQGVPNPDNACLILLAQSQIDILNNDYHGTNSDINNWTNGASSLFSGVDYGEACLSFCLASKNHPTGYGLNDGDFAVTINQTSGDFNADWSGYLNIFVQFNTGVLGYSPLGGSGNGDGVVIDASAFGSGTGCGDIAPQSPYNLGRTLTHELGHYLLLDHIWGGGCGSDDEVGDTPNSAQPYYGCPNNGVSSCNSTDMHMNYMDYVNDLCMYMFSGGQASRMENYTNSNLRNLITNASNVCDGSGGGGGDGGGNGGGDSADCAAPDDASATTQSETSVLIDWSDVPEASNYRVQYKEKGSASWTSNDVNLSEYLITGLLASTSYEYRVRSRCGGTWTTWSAIQEFTTNGDGGGDTDDVCETPTNISDTVVDETSVDLNWDAMPDAIKYKVRYRELGTSTWTRKTSTANNYSISGLAASTTYQFAVRTKCPEGWTRWSTTDIFTTDGNDGGDDCTDVLFELILDDYGSETSWELVSEDGEQFANGGPYADGDNGAMVTEEFCLENGCFSIYVDDSFGDGICVIMVKVRFR